MRGKKRENERERLDRGIGLVLRQRALLALVADGLGGPTREVGRPSWAGFLSLLFPSLFRKKKERPKVSREKAMEKNKL